MQLRKQSQRAHLCKVCQMRTGMSDRRFDWYENLDADTPVGRNGKRWVMVDRTDMTTHAHHANGDRKASQYVGDKVTGQTPQTPQDAPQAPQTPQATGKPADVNALADAVVSALRPRLGDLLDPDALRRRINEQGQTIMQSIADQLQADMAAKIESLQMPVRIEAVDPITGQMHDLGIQHREFPRLVRWLGTRRVNILAVGPAGSGKTTAYEAAAKALGIPFFPKSLGPSSREYEFAGFQGPSGMVHGILREPFENGGLLVLDEMDRANPAVLTILNAALANAYFSFPDKVVKRHPDFVCAAAANTWGSGADRQYVGATQVDASTINRFVFISWDYDEDLERAISQSYAEQAKDAATKARVVNWFKRVQAIRKAVFATQARVVVSPRATIYGSILMLAGESEAAAEDATIWLPVGKDDKAKVLANVH